MNTKQKMIKAMREYRKAGKSMEEILDVALAILADPENWTDEMHRACYVTRTWTRPDAVRAVINLIREQEPKP